MTKTYIALIAPKAVRNAEICSIADPLIANEDDWLPDASDACVIIPFTDKILPCRPGPTPSLKQ